MADEIGIKVQVSGIFPLSHFEFQYDNTLAYKTYFTQEMLKLGFLGYTSFYASLAHTDEIVDKYLDACGQVWEDMKRIVQRGENIEQYLNGPVCHAGFERLN